MTAERLRRAADRLAELTAAATDENGGWYAEHEIHSALGQVGTTTDASADAAYIAAMSPEVGEALAAWLRAQAGYVDTCEDFGVPAGAGAEEADALARLVLGAEHR